MKRWIEGLMVSVFAVVVLALAFPAWAQEVVTTAVPEADLSGADLYSANLSGADLSGARLYKTNLAKADLRGAIIDKYQVDSVLLSLNMVGWV